MMDFGSLSHRPHKLPHIRRRSRNLHGDIAAIRAPQVSQTILAKLFDQDFQLLPHQRTVKFLGQLPFQIRQAATAFLANAAGRSDRENSPPACLPWR